MMVSNSFRILFTTWVQRNVIVCHYTEYNILLVNFLPVYSKICLFDLLSFSTSSLIVLFLDSICLITFCLCNGTNVNFFYIRQDNVINSIAICNKTTVCVLR